MLIQETSQSHKLEKHQHPVSVCPICNSSNWDVFFEMLKVPIFCNVLWPDLKKALNCERGDIRLAFCSNCSFIGNVDFDLKRLKYTQAYENSLDFSPHFQNYAQSLASRLVEKHCLYRKNIIEIGCGKGDFLVSLCAIGNSRGIGFDPTYVHLEEHSQITDQISFIQDYYSEKYANFKSDFIACRHTLEHIQFPKSLLASIRTAIGDSDTAIFFEVPNALDTFCRMRIWDIIYEHCCFFTPASLSYAFSTSGFNICDISEEFQGQFLCLEAVPSTAVYGFSHDNSTAVKQVANNISLFSTNFKNKVADWKKKLEQFSYNKSRIALWGAGSKGVTFLNVLNVRNQVEYIVDINSRKQGMYVAGTGQKIVAPDFLTTYNPDVVIAMNPVYRDEIRKMLNELELTHTQLQCV